MLEANGCFKADGSRKLVLDVGANFGYFAVGNDSREAGSFLEMYEEVLVFICPIRICVVEVGTRKSCYLLSAIA